MVFEIREIVTLSYLKYLFSLITIKIKNYSAIILYKNHKGNRGSVGLDSSQREKKQTNKQPVEGIIHGHNNTSWKNQIPDKIVRANLVNS